MSSVPVLMSRESIQEEVARATAICSRDLPDPHLHNPFPKFDIEEVLQRIARANTVSVPSYDGTRGPFKITSLSYRSRTQQESKVQEYCACFFNQYSGSLTTLRKELKDAEGERSPIALGSTQPRSSTVSVTTRALITISERDILNNYLELKNKLDQQATWDHYLEMIQQRAELTEADRTTKTQNLQRLRSELSSGVLYFCHYSPQSLLKACLHLADLEKMIREAQSSAFGWQTGRERIDRLLITQIEKEFRTAYSQYLEQFLERIQKIEKERLCQSIYFRLKIAKEANAITRVDVIQYISEKLIELGVMQPEEIKLAHYVVTEEEWNELIKWYCVYEGPKNLSEFLFYSSRDSLGLGVEATLQRHAKGWITCLAQERDGFGIFPDSLFHGTAPATLACYHQHYYELQEALKNQPPNPCYKEWTALLAIVNRELSVLFQKSSLSKHRGGLLVLIWRIFWTRIATKILGRFETVCEPLVKSMQSRERKMSAEEVQFLATLYRLAQQPYVDLEVKDDKARNSGDRAALVKRYCQTVPKYYEVVRKFFFKSIHNLAASSSQNPEDRVNTAEVRLLFDLIEVFASGNSANAIQTLTQVIRNRISLFSFRSLEKAKSRRTE